MTPMKAIRLKCLDCCCGNVAEVKRCPCPDCSLYAYRLGKNPAMAGRRGNAAALRKSPVVSRDITTQTASGDMGAVESYPDALDRVLCDVEG
jgi:hypothetical protein